MGGLWSWSWKDFDYRGVTGGKGYLDHSQMVERIHDFGQGIVDDTIWKSIAN